MLKQHVETAAHPMTVVVSAGQSRNPAKRELEEAVASSAAELDSVQVLKVPHLYDLPYDSQSYQTLRQLAGDLVVVSWLYDRATHWILDRNGVGGQFGEVWLKPDDTADEEDESEGEVADEASEERVVDSQPRPGRQIFCIDFRVSDKAADYSAEFARIQQVLSDNSPPSASPNAGETLSDGADLAKSTHSGVSASRLADPTADAPAPATSAAEALTLERLQRMADPTNDTYVGSPANGQAASGADEALPEALTHLFGASSVATIDEHHGRRWYPVIDFSRCTNCMECIDFCLFGVYGVDSLETIVVEQADNCRKGCPACSRVCPQNAIIFPQHKTPAIAGAPVDGGGLKIDLSKLFGAPETDEDPAVVAARERDEQLILAGRQAVGNASDVEQRLAESQAKKQQADELDDLLDELDSLDL